MQVVRLYASKILYSGCTNDAMKVQIESFFKVPERLALTFDETLYHDDKPKMPRLQSSASVADDASFVSRLRPVNSIGDLSVAQSSSSAPSQCTSNLPHVSSTGSIFSATAYSPVTAGVRQSPVPMSSNLQSSPQLRQMPCAMRPNIPSPTTLSLSSSPRVSSATMASLPSPLVGIPSVPYSIALLAQSAMQPTAVCPSTTGSSPMSQLCNSTHQRVSYCLCREIVEPTHVDVLACSKCFLLCHASCYNIDKRSMTPETLTHWFCARQTCRGSRYMQYLPSQNKMPCVCGKAYPEIPSSASEFDWVSCTCCYRTFHSCCVDSDTSAFIEGFKCSTCQTSFEGF